ncbi:hypothetical protein H0E84_04775 [Luteimonas sp. SJ-92]|uniref:Uncharacterized protein n=1 Tax=Luteimonas salinisoli TaxID=2752307 RepID=A0A853JAK4_9GAMM|nr:hypothetical protein [Luteimonas salinisoli]NZA25688.1 hypothetical protein [Luteimonas salinisoli]
MKTRKVKFSLLCGVLFGASAALSAWANTTTVMPECDWGCVQQCRQQNCDPGDWICNYFDCHWACGCEPL